MKLFTLAYKIKISFVRFETKMYRVYSVYNKISYINFFKSGVGSLLRL